MYDIHVFTTLPVALRIANFYSLVSASISRTVQLTRGMRGVKIAVHH